MLGVASRGGEEDREGLGVGGGCSGSERVSAVWTGEVGRQGGGEGRVDGWEAFGESHPEDTGCWL